MGTNARNEVVGAFSVIVKSSRRFVASSSGVMKVVPVGADSIEWSELAEGEIIHEERQQRGREAPREHGGSGDGGLKR